MEARRIVGQVHIEETVLEQWVEAGWLIPHQQPGQQPSQRPSHQRFSDIDLARACLIRDLRDLGVNDESMPIVLDLVDQLHGLRSVVRELLSTMKSRGQAPERR